MKTNASVSDSLLMNALARLLFAAVLVLPLWIGYVLLALTR